MIVFFFVAGSIQYDAALCFYAAGIIPQQFCVLNLCIQEFHFVAGITAGIYVASAGLRHCAAGMFSQDCFQC